MFAKTITEFGARPETLCTAAIQSAIDACHMAGGGEVIIEDGCYITGTLFLHSFVTLVIRPNGILQASTDGDDYPDFDTCFGKENAPRRTARCLIYAENCEQIAILGGGTIDCRGECFCEYTNNDRFFRRTTDKLPARMVFFYGCSHIRIRDITMRDMAGGWAYWLNGCSFADLRGLKILCDPRYPNSDGVHINCSSDVTLSDSVIHCGDDAIILRANNKTMPVPRPCERVTVTNCSIKTQSCAVRIGWTNDGEIKNSVFSNLTVTDSWYGISIEFPKKSPEPFTDQGNDATVVKNLAFDNIVMDNIETSPIRILSYPYNNVDSISDIFFRGIIATSKALPVFRVENGVKVCRIRISDSDFRTLQKSGTIELVNISDVSLNNVSFGNLS